MLESNDDYDFSPSESSNLASLFQEGTRSFTTNDLIYKAPKQPKHNAPAQTQAVTTTTVPQKTQLVYSLSTGIEIWKMMDNDLMEPMGNVGIAITSNTNKFHEIIIYKDKKLIFLRQEVQKLKFTLRKPSSYTFSDGSDDNWCIKFNGETFFKEFTERFQQYGGAIEKNGNEEVANPLEIVDDSSQQNIKANILTRMTKMGHSVLPRNIQSQSDRDTSDTDSESNANRYKFQSKPKEQKIVSGPMIPIFDKQNHQNTYQTLQYQDPFSLLSLEQNELRLNLSHISRKLDNALEMRHNVHSDVENKLKSKNKVLELQIKNLQQQAHYFETKYRDLEFKYTKTSNSIKSVKELEDVIENQSKQINQLQAINKSLQLQFSDGNKNAGLENKLADFLHVSQENQLLKEKLNKYEKETLESASSLNVRKLIVTQIKHSLNNFYVKMKPLLEMENKQDVNISVLFLENLKETSTDILSNVHQIFENDKAGEIFNPK